MVKGGRHAWWGVCMVKRVVHGEGSVCGKGGMHDEGWHAW